MDVGASQSWFTKSKWLAARATAVFEHRLVRLLCILVRNLETGTTWRDVATLLRTVLSRFTCRLHFLGDFFGTLAVMEYDRAGTSSAAKRRRERRLRAAWRHEQLSVKMALAAAQHHSAPKSAGPRRTKPHGDRRKPGQLGSDRRLWRRCPDRRRWQSRSVTWLPPGLLVEWALLQPEEQERIRMEAGEEEEAGGDAELGGWQEEEEEEEEEETSSQFFTFSLGLQWIQVPASVPEAFWDEFHIFST